MELFLSGRDVEINSTQESIAIVALRRRNNIKLVTTMSIINAIIHASDKIAYAVSTGATSPPTGEGLKKSVEQLQTLLVPEYGEEIERKAERFKKLLIKEAEGGPINIRAINKKRANRVTKRRTN